MGEIAGLFETRTGLKFIKIAEGLEEHVSVILAGYAQDLELIYQSVAPKKDTRLARGIRAEPTGVLSFEIISTAKDPVTGYSYTGVTRFGHKKLYITPKQRSSASVISTRRLRATGRRAALRIVLPSGEVIFRNRVAAYRPTSDWAEKGFTTAVAEAKAVSATIGHKVITGFSS